MKKSRIAIYVGFGILIAIMVAGVILLIIDEETSVKSTTYEVIAFLVGITGMLMAIFAEIDATKQRRRNDKMMREINKIAESENEDTEILKEILKNLGKDKRKK